MSAVKTFCGRVLTRVGSVCVVDLRWDWFLEIGDISSRPARRNVDTLGSVSCEIQRATRLEEDVRNATGELVVPLTARFRSNVWRTTYNISRLCQVCVCVCVYSLNQK